MVACGKCNASSGGAATPSGLLECSRCQKQWYCCKECQRSDWPGHKKSCFTRKERKVQRQVVRDTTVKECNFCSKTEKAEGEVSLSTCARCRAVRYCSSKSQKADWMAHKNVCGKSARKKTVNPLQETCQLEMVNAERCRRMGDRAGEGRAYSKLGISFRRLGQFKKAVEHHTKHLAIAKELGDRAGEGIAYSTLGSAFNSLGQYQKAVE